MSKGQPTKHHIAHGSVYRPADIHLAFLLRGSEDCVIEQCKFHDSGGNSIPLDLYAQKNRVEGNEIRCMGQGSIILTGYGREPRMLTRRTTSRGAATSVRSASFRLRSDSPALKMGIRQIDLSGIGVARQFPKRLLE